MSRSAIKKSVRFEVLKRDSFTCQYCGAQAPDVVLEIDHISPVAGGGDNDIMNLITSCNPCNAGKSDRALDDNSIIAKQKAQLDELNERREQLEMMLQWRQALADLDGQSAAIINEKFKDETGFTLNESGERNVRKWLKKYSLSDLLEALDDSLLTYFKTGETSKEEQAAFEKTFAMVPRIVASKRRNADKPWMKDLFYTRAILRNRMTYCVEHVAIRLLSEAYELGAPIENLQDWAKRATSWTNWKDEMEEWISELSGSPSA